ncbi:class I SAM-dependent methyltransferase [Sandaracinus amylolyticus]|uniref:Methyltransferase n=1 Tax=Sandaracinus amylolyticus TaxID=927083 RepID=A0A0F6SF37_9BACT|nr:class I SAM-dependent methyltransferase [Sandaracinus amylolyticus]AKF06264.1 Methyltransferase [Sandaracinus amylolyticus]
MKREGPSEHALRHGSESHYVDARLYDHTYARRKHDVRFYVEMAREIGGSVLELGAGSGRVALAIAREGIDVVAVDRMDSMLARFRERLGRQPIAAREHVSIVKGDLLSLRLRRKFRLVIAPFNVFMHLYRREDVEAALATCRAHLMPRDGRLVFDVLMPDFRAFVRDPHRQYRARPIVDPSDGRKWEYGEQFQFDPATQIQMVTSVLRNPDDPGDLRVLPLAHRQFFPAELEALLHYNGFEMVERWGDFQRGPLSVDGESQVIVARLRRGKR